MPSKKRPRHGSLQYWPRKRSRKICPSVNWNALEAEKAKPTGFAAYKAGMAHVYFSRENANVSTPVTVLEASPIFICGARFYGISESSSSRVLGETWSEKLPKNAERKTGKMNPKKPFDYEKNKDAVIDVRLMAMTQPDKSGMHKKKPELFEIGIAGSVKDKTEYAKSVIGKEINAADVFRPGEYCDITSVTKGHGFTGAVKRFGIKIQGRKDEQHHRHPGSVGSTTPRKIDWRVPLPGQYGFFKRTEYSKKIISIKKDAKEINPSSGWQGYGVIKENFILLEGSVPGPRKRLIMLTLPRRKVKYEPVEVKKIVLK